MKRLTREWVAKGEGDWLSAGVVFRSRAAPNYDLTCFLCQQSSEKYLKAQLQEASIAFRKTHDLLALTNLLLPICPSFSLLQPAAALLREYAVDFRYPGKSADKSRARQALAHCSLIREAVRRELGLTSIARVPSRRRKTKRKPSATSRRR